MNPLVDAFRRRKLNLLLKMKICVNFTTRKSVSEILLIWYFLMSLTPESAGNVIGKLLKFGVDNKLIVKRYINMLALENDTFALLEKVVKPLNWDQHQELVHDLIDMWYPALSTINEKGGCEFSHMFDTDLKVQTILNSEGYTEIEEELENE